MVPLRWPAFLWVLALAGCLQASVAPGDGLEGTSRVPSIALVRDEQEDRLVVNAVEAGFEWATLGVSADRAGTQVRALGAEDGDGESPPVALLPGEFRPASSSPDDVLAGDVLRFCAVDGVTEPVTYKVAETDSNTIVYATTFASVASCG
jgi:hypothetical protein